MKLGIDARLFCKHTGIGRYTRSLCVEYYKAQRCRDHPLILLTDRPFPPPSPQDINPSSGQTLKPWTACVRPVIADCRRRMLWTHRHVPSLLRQHDLDVYHAVCNFELPWRKVCRYVVTIHDLVPLFFPKSVPRKHVLFFRLFMKHAAHTADLIITDSEHSKRDIVRYLHVSEKKIRVIYLGYDPPKQQVCDPQKVSALLKGYGICKPYLLFVGAIEPKKNLERLVKAFHMFREHDREGTDLQLVLAGGESWMSEGLYRTVRELNLDQHVIFTGVVPDAELPLFYHEAEAFVFPSIYEGFGLPVLEAMSHRIPVITSNVSSLPEIVGAAGYLVDPQQPASICDGMLHVLSDRAKREEMIRRGVEQAQKFSWKTCAEKTWQVYLDAMALS
ncbi:group 1 glycosyl transferase [candidate division KSB3 bacterium]|uniref:Group 1 glycosyl transferase n=1 Tax=candidate division KSB3 bacterium TaxID=2044937 RepID=A0A2G6E4A1_9BACT|nr:MAG: group 1 glycosyl transferase [candidate division KSB3 bacterium]